MSFDNLMKKYGVQGHAANVPPTEPPKTMSSSANQSQPSAVSTNRDHPHTNAGSTPAGHTPFFSPSTTFGSQTTSDERRHETPDYPWNHAGSFGSNDDISYHDDGFRSSVRHHPKGARNITQQMRQWPWTDIIFIVLIMVEAVVLLANLDALFYAILPFVSNLLLLLIIVGAVVLVLYFMFGRRRR